ncbi:MAG: hypothetical protein CVV02_07895 [Firmicutes bacterium HGW-Firmicutes-7]|nr:MAG: hypothetical protein CVV02_07895 [Firmicutes bacterium HGW-Firmicutes-7]
MMKKVRVAILILACALAFTSCKPSEKETLNEEAYQLYLLKDFNGAIQSYTKAIDSYPDYSDFYTNRGMSYHEIGENELAIKDLDKAIELDSKSPEAYSSRGYVNLIQGYNNSALEDLNKALDLKKRFESKDGLMLTYLNMGTLKSVLGNKNDALEWYDKAINLGNDDPGVYNAKGMVLIDLERCDDALNCFNSALEADPNFAYAFSNRASVYFIQGKLDIAMADISTALRIESNVPQFYIIQGQILSALDNSEEAIKVYSAAISIWPGYAEAYFQRGNEYFKNEKFTDAIFDFTFAKDYGLNEGYKGLGKAFRKIGQNEDAIVSFSKYLDVAGDDTNIYMELGITYKEIKAYEKALSTFDRVITLTKDFAEPYILKGLTYEEMGKYHEAINMFNKAIELEPDNQMPKDKIKYIQETFQ